MRLSHLIVLGVLLGLGAGGWLRRDAAEPVAASHPAAQPPVAAAALKEPVARVTAPPAIAAPSIAQAADAPRGLLLPVRGVLASQLRDTFTDARSEGRVHDAIDIMADAGTPVLAVADGTVEKLFDSERGGLTIYQFEPSGRWCYYYAHLQRYADGLAEKQSIKRGQVIGYVGSTGNASAEAPHLHFEVHMLGPEKQWWKGESINPYPLLKHAAASADAASGAG
ncbi:M23 family metallopeptidase [uncultured Stenotrophomonas sp.]|uniref:M23 family metallopeptidase n=1 Tax=uncultured Stenotrophomonas sp. TaxID=165438 RepID=UPI0025EFBB72|nr:M23 family metallopeptidase [uncultured Stenotrophomonas sp.]